jgi:hypothetical protein
MKKRSTAKIIGWGATTLVIGWSIWETQGPIIAILILGGGAATGLILSYRAKRRNQ